MRQIGGNRSKASIGFPIAVTRRLEVAGARWGGDDKIQLAVTPQVHECVCPVLKTSFDGEPIRSAARRIGPISQRPRVENSVGVRVQNAREPLAIQIHKLMAAMFEKSRDGAVRLMRQRFECRRLQAEWRPLERQGRHRFGGAAAKADMRDGIEQRQRGLVVEILKFIGADLEEVPIGVILESMKHRDPNAAKGRANLEPRLVRGERVRACPIGVRLIRFCSLVLAQGLRCRCRGICEANFEMPVIGGRPCVRVVVPIFNSMNVFVPLFRPIFIDDLVAPGVVDAFYQPLKDTRLVGRGPQCERLRSSRKCC